MHTHDSRVLVGEHLEWLSARGYARTTIRARGRQLGAFLAWGVARGLENPEDYSLVEIEDYRLYMHRQGDRNGAPLGWGSKVQPLLAIKGFFRWLTMTRRIRSNPAADVELPRRPRRLPRGVLTITEMERLLRQPDLRRREGLRDRAILEVLYSTGIRRAECAGLGLGDLDLDRQVVLVRSGKGARDRYVPVGFRALHWVSRYVEEVRRLLIRGPDLGHLFLSRRGAPLSPKGVGIRVRRHLDAAGLTRAGACHLLRHTTATLLLEGGADIRYIQEILGHAQLSTTAIYARVSVDRLREVHWRCHPAGGAQGQRGTSTARPC